MYVDDPNNPEETDERMARGEAVAFVPDPMLSPGYLFIESDDGGGWPEGWVPLGFTEEGEST